MHFTWNPDPVVFELFSLQMRWYGLLFVSGFLVGFYIMQWMYRREGKDVRQLDKLLYFMFAGAVIGALIGKAVDLGIDQKFVKEVSNALEPGKSALFIIVRDSNPDVAIAALKPYKGTVFHTTLTPEQEENLRGVLKKEIK